jgi:ribosomal protein L37AE/L43A
MAMTDQQTMSFDAALNNARGIGVMSGAAIEREYERSKGRDDCPECGGVRTVVYRHASGVWKCTRCTARF